jgi:hypothetical protein
MDLLSLKVCSFLNFISLYLTNFHKENLNLIEPFLFAIQILINRSKYMLEPFRKGIVYHFIL